MQNTMQYIRIIMRQERLVFADDKDEPMLLGTNNWKQILQFLSKLVSYSA